MLVVRMREEGGVGDGGSVQDQCMMRKTCGGQKDPESALNGEVI